MSFSSFISAGQLFQPHRRTSRGFRVGGGVHDSYTFQCGLVGSFTSPGIDTGQIEGTGQRLLLSHPKDTGKAG